MGLGEHIDMEIDDFSQFEQDLMDTGEPYILPLRSKEGR